MLRSLLLFIFLALPPAIFSQTLPDVSFESIDGEVHRAYDILDEGKPIVFYFFFIDCPKCETVTPQLASLYNTLGADQACFEVIALDISEDTAMDVQSYAESKNASFPFCVQDKNPSIISFLFSHFEGQSVGSPAVVVFAPDRSRLFAGTGINVMSEGPIATLVAQNSQLPCTVVADIDEVSNTFQLFPNPISNGPLTIELENPGEYQLELFNASGKNVMRKIAQFENVGSIELPTLESGVYYLSLQQGDLRSVSKLVRL